MKQLFSIFSLLFLFTTQGAAHQASSHEHAQLIPIPVYDQPFGPASATAALQAAEVLLDSFDATVKDQFMFDIGASVRTKWSNLPAGIVERSGISVGELSDDQRRLLFDFLASSLSEEGYQSIMEVMAAESFLSADKRAERLKWDPENYWVSFFGTPSSDQPWGWQFGGHHIAINISIENGSVKTMSPSFIGTEPAIFTVNGENYEAVRDMHLSGFAVFSVLDASQQAKADAGNVPEDILTGPGEKGTIPKIIGLSAAEMSEEQQSLLVAAIAEWVNIQPDENASRRREELVSGIGDISFAWTGNDDVNTPAYMRIQGPSLIIEMLSTGGNVGESAAGQGHYHTIYRKPNMEYGNVNIEVEGVVSKVLGFLKSLFR